MSRPKGYIIGIKVLSFHLGSYMQISMFHLLGIAVGRYIAACHPHYYPQLWTKRRMIMFATFCWVLPFGIMAMVAINSRQKMENDQHGSSSYKCLLHEIVECYALILMPPIYSASTIFIAAIYMKVFYILYKRRNRSIFGVNSTTQERQNQRQNDIAVCITLFATVIYFSVCHIPLQIVNAISCYRTDVDQTILAVFETFLNLYSSLNPLIYGLGNKQTRKSVLDIFFNMKTTRCQNCTTRSVTTNIAMTETN